MNTDDERREEFTRASQRNQSLRFSNTDLLNVINGNIVCSFEPADLQELKHENSFSLCCNQARNNRVFRCLSNLLSSKTKSKNNSGINFDISNFKRKKVI
jgi:hypothetical protein